MTAILTHTHQPASTQHSRTRKNCPTTLAGIGTAVPRYAASQQQACDFMERVLTAGGETNSGTLALLRRIYKQSGIERRYSVVADYVARSPADYTFFPNNDALEPFPSTAARMAAYERESVGLAADAARTAITAAGINAGDITHLVISTCTGFFAPGLDVLLVQQLGLPPTVARTILGFMGCYAGVSGIRVCDDIVRANPKAVVLQLAIELCSLHYQKDATADTFVAHALFADGAAAAVYLSSEAAGPHGGPQVRATHSRVCADTTDRMSWRIGDTGFVMRLDSHVPQLLHDVAAAFVDELAAKGGLSREDLTGWAVHPGGPRILRAIEESLALTPDALESSFTTLRDHGNMSSATILFVLEREFQRLSGQTGGNVAALAFGPGLTVEGALLQIA